MHMRWGACNQGASARSKPLATCLPASCFRFPHLECLALSHPHLTLYALHLAPYSSYRSSYSSRVIPHFLASHFPRVFFASLASECPVYESTATRLGEEQAEDIATCIATYIATHTATHLATDSMPTRLGEEQAEDHDGRADGLLREDVEEQREDAGEAEDEVDDAVPSILGRGRG